MNTDRAPAWRMVVGVLGAVWFALSCADDPGRRAFEQGMREYERGRNVRAIALLEKSLNQRPASPDNAVANYYIGLAARKLGRIERAIEAFEASRRQDPDAAKPIYALAVLYFEGGDFERAQPLFEECAQRMPADPRPLEFLARLYLQTGRIAMARRALLIALSRESGSPRILTSLALVEQAAGDSTKALFYLRQALDRDGRYAPALFNMGWWQHNIASNRTEAAVYLQQFLAVETNEARRIEARAMLAAVKSPAATAESVAVPVAAKPAPQAPESSAVPAAAPLSPPAPPTLDERLAEAKKWREQGKTEEAVALCLQLAGESERAGDRAGQRRALQQALALGFDRSAAHLAYGQYCAAQEDWTNALRSFKQAVILQRDNVQAHRALANVALRMGEYDAALVALRQVIQLQSDSPDAWWDLAVLYDEHIKMSARAVESYREFINRFPGDPRVVKAQKRVQELEPPAAPPPMTAPAAVSPPPAQSSQPAAPAMPRAVASRPSGDVRLNIRRPAVRNQQAAVQAYNRGTLYQQRGEWDQAIFYYTRALENDDTFVTAYFNLGAVYWARGDHALAKEAYRKALELEPQADAVRYNLALLHYELREWDAAIQELKTLLEKSPDYAQAHYLLGMLYSQNPQQAALARTHYQKFLELAPGDPAAPAVERWLKQQPGP
jgi:tetratricopeptide (TPR) repeat protein